MSTIKYYKGGEQPLELHKVRVVQKLHLVPIERRISRYADRQWCECHE